MSVVRVEMILMRDTVMLKIGRRSCMQCLIAVVGNSSRCGVASAYSSVMISRVTVRVGFSIIAVEIVVGHSQYKGEHHYFWCITLLSCGNRRLWRTLCWKRLSCGICFGGLQKECWPELCRKIYQHRSSSAASGQVAVWRVRY